MLVSAHFCSAEPALQMREASYAVTACLSSQDVLESDAGGGQALMLRSSPWPHPTMERMRYTIQIREICIGREGVAAHTSPNACTGGHHEDQKQLVSGPWAQHADDDRGQQQGGNSLPLRYFCIA